MTSVFKIFEGFNFIHRHLLGAVIFSWLDALITGFCPIFYSGLYCIVNFRKFGLSVYILMKRIELVSSDLGLIVDLNT